MEQAEAGLSRILAAYSSDVPSVIGPVRSARETDLELLRQFNKPTLAYSGAQSALRPSIEAAPLDALPPSKAPDAYFRSGDRAAPHNLCLRPGKIPHAPTGVDAAEDIGLRFAAPPPGGTPVTACQRKVATGGQNSLGNSRPEFPRAHQPLPTTRISLGNMHPSGRPKNRTR